MKDIELNTTWLHGKYTIGGEAVEINTAISYVSIGDRFFAQGDEADKIINEIHRYWLQYNVRVSGAIEHWIKSNL